MNAVYIKKNSKAPWAFDALRWVLKARATNEMRKTLTGINSDGNGEFVATDGHRLHVAKIPEYAALITKGIWHRVYTDASRIVLEPYDGDAYPEYQRVIPTKFDNARSGRITAPKNDLAWLWKYFSITGVHVNPKYLEDLVSGQTEWEVKRAEDQNENTMRPVFFESNECGDINLRAIVMPLKVRP